MEHLHELGLPNEGLTRSEACCLRRCRARMEFIQNKKQTLGTGENVVDNQGGDSTSRTETIGLVSSSDFAAIALVFESKVGISAPTVAPDVNSTLSGEARVP